MQAETLTTKVPDHLMLANVNFEDGPCLRNFHLDLLDSEPTTFRFCSQ
jgi:hypothetical protein